MAFVATSFFDLVRAGAAPFDAPGFAAEELTELVHAAMDLLPPSLAADLLAHRPALDHHEPGGSWADLVAGHDHVAEPLGAGHPEVMPAGHAVDHDPFDFGSGATHRVTIYGDHVDHDHAGFDAHHHADAHLEHDDHGWAHHEMDHHHGLVAGHDALLGELPGHEHVGLHDSVLHEHVHDPGHDPHVPGHEGHHDPAHHDHHDGGWHHE
jgi:hypothetical protein